MRTAAPAARQGHIGLKLVLGLAFLAAGAALAWMIVLPLAAAAYLRGQTGCDTEIGSLYANPFTGHLAVENLVMANPPGFPRPDFLRVRALEIDASPRALFARRRVIDRARIEIASLSFVRDARGRVNVRQLAHGGAGAPAPAPSAASAPAGTGFFIRQLELRIDRAVVADYSTGTPVVREFDVHFQHTYRDVTSGQQLAEPLAAALGNLAGAVGDLLPEWDGWRRHAGGRLREAGRRAGETLKDVFESLEKSLGK